MFQLALPSSEDQDRELRENQASITVAAKLYNQNEKKGLTEIKTEAKPPAKKTLGTWSDIPHWSKKALDQHGKKKGRNLERIQQEEEKDADVFIRYNTWQRNDLNVARHMVEKHLRRAVDINPERVPSPAIELLETELVNTEDSAEK